MAAKTTGMPLLATDNISIAAAGRVLVSGLTFSVEGGETLRLSGPSGCGKTTLLRALAQLVDVRVGDLRLGGSSPAELGYPTWRARVSLLQQQPAFHDEPVADALARPFQFATRAGRRYLPDEAVLLLRRLGLAESVLEQHARSLSVGQQQRVALVRGLLVQPAVLLLDEPTSALDDASTTAVVELLQERAAGGLAIIVVTHDLRLNALCDRTLDLSLFACAQAQAR